MKGDITKLFHGEFTIVESDVDQTILMRWGTFINDFGPCTPENVSRATACACLSFISQDRSDWNRLVQVYTLMCNTKYNSLLDETSKSFIAKLKLGNQQGASAALIEYLSKVGVNKIELVELPREAVIQN